VHAALPHVPICGMGGIRTGADALEFILAGASTVSAGTVLFNDPSAPTRIERELTLALAAAGFDRLADAIGYAHRPPGPDEVAGDEATAPHPELPDDEDSDDFGPDVDALAQ
jgi:dihydroorotate dehydrogenase (NAD+) catalytic subunit